MGSYLYALIIYPLEMFIETVFSVSMNMVPGVGYAILFVSIAVQLLSFPMYRHADELQDEERDRQRQMKPVVDHIKKTFKGDERVMMLSAYYRTENYHQYYQLRAILPLLLQIPFFMAAYNFLSDCKALDGASFYFLRDMGKPDAMLTIGGIAINIMPIAMTVINLISGMIYTRGLDLKDKLQLYLTAGVFLVLLYDSPSGLVFYWTLNNVFSLLKNIFMKLVKNPRPIICVGTFLFVSAYSFKCYQRGALDSADGRLVIIAIMIMGSIPLVGYIIDTFRKKNGILPGTVHEVTKEERFIFTVSAASLTVTIGALIPTSTIASSPTEFVVRGHYVHPLVQVLYCLIVAAGMFILWGNIIFRFYGTKARRVFCPLLFAVSACALVNSQFFRQGLNNMSMNMIYYDGFGYDISEKLINLVILAAVAAVCVVLYRFTPKTVMVAAFALLGVTVVLSGRNMIRINSTIDATEHIKEDDFYINNEARYCLDRKGKNVVVLFEDRAFGQFLPYIINEKPELAEVYSGFTYYKNTISFGTRTLTGSPALFGGYEYSSYNLRDKGDDFRTDSVKVMPKLFAENGFKTTVFDKPHYIDLSNSSIEEFFHDVDPRISAYHVDGVVKTKEEADADFDYFEKSARSNFIRHSVFLSSPLLLRSFLYDRGTYLMQTMAEDRITYAGHIEEIKKLPQLANVSDNGDNTFTIIENDAPHSMDVNLQMPDYTLEDDVDNSVYYEKWKERLGDIPGGRPINMDDDVQIQAYEVNMSTILEIGEWIKYLKENDLYDNTRIIIVADHGYSYFAFDDMIMDVGNGDVTDLEMFTPLLMVKDFAASSGDGAADSLATSDEFMTNGDVPVLAMNDLIEDPVNPYTGNPISNAQKYERSQYIYDDRIWLSVHDDIYDLKNWKVEDIR